MHMLSLISLCFHPLQKVSLELTSEKRVGDSMTDGLDLDETSLVLSNNMKARKHSEDARNERLGQGTGKKNSNKPPQHKEKFRKTNNGPNGDQKPKHNAVPAVAARKKEKEPKLSQFNRYIAEDSDDDQEEAPVVMAQVSGIKSKKRKSIN